MSVKSLQQNLVIESDDAGRRLDQVLAERWPDYSRSRLAAWIRDGQLRVDGRQVKPRHAVAAGEQVALAAELIAHPDNPQPQAIALDLLYEDEALLIINKPAGLVVHPGSGNQDGTLVNALLHHDPDLAPLPRAGLIHRLDKDTSGCLVVARTLASHRFLVTALKKRLISRHYQALVWGEPVAGGSVREPIGRHPVDRRRQMVRADGREAVTHYRIGRRGKGCTLLDVALETGRTHQIRVHLSYIRLPIIGDPVYGRRGAPAGLSPDQREAWICFPRQALHARRIVVPHPDDQRPIEAVSPLPEDFQQLLAMLGA